MNFARRIHNTYNTRQYIECVKSQVDAMNRNIVYNHKSHIDNALKGELTSRVYFDAFKKYDCSWESHDDAMNHFNNTNEHGARYKYCGLLSRNYIQLSFKKEWFTQIY
jgi:hypothetical protein